MPDPVTGTVAAVGTLGGALLSSNAAKSAANTQAAAARDASQLQWQQYLQNRQDMMPWMNMGQGALGQLGYLMGIPGNYGNFAQMAGPEGRVNRPNPENNMGGMAYNMRGPQELTEVQGSFGGYDNPQQGAPAEGQTGFQVNPGMGSFGSLARSFGMSDFNADPGYAFRLSEGQKALERSAAARGSLLGGGTLKALTKYGQDMGSQEYMNAYNRFNNDQTTLYNRLSGLSGGGQQAANTLGNMGMNTSNMIGNNITDAGSARAAGQTGSANAWANAIGSGVNTWADWNMRKALGR